MKKITRTAVAKFKFKKTYWKLSPEQKQEVLWEMTARKLQTEEDEDKKKIRYVVTNLDGTEHGIYTKQELEALFSILFQSLRPYIGTGKRFKGLYYIKRYKP